MLDFSLSSSVGSLCTSVVFTDKTGAKRPYHIEAGIRSDRLIVIFTAQDMDEPNGIDIFPKVVGYKDKHCGVILLKSWDDSSLLCASILSIKPLFAITDEGTVPDDTAKKLDDLWLSESSKIIEYFPRINFSSMGTKAEPVGSVDQGHSGPVEK